MGGLPLSTWLGLLGLLCLLCGAPVQGNDKNHKVSKESARASMSRRNDEWPRSPKAIGV